MPPKRKAVTPPPKKSVKSKSKPAQTSIDNFFASPSKTKNGAEKKRSISVISFIDSDDELPPQPQGIQLSGGDDEKVARELQERFDTENVVSPDKGKGREVIEEDEEDGDGIEIIKEEIHVKKEGINGSSSSKVHPMFAASIKTPTKPKTTTPTTTVKAEPGSTNGNGTGSPAKITTSSAEAVDPIDFDVDQYLFRPSQVDVSKWPKGRLPYSVLVGVYVQVSSTRSRLLIVRVLTK